MYALTSCMRRSKPTPILLTALSLLFLLHGCNSREVANDPKLFTLLPADSTGIHFINSIIEDENVNPLQYENSYNGGGVAIGDVNNDGLDDVFFTSNTDGNRLYLNRGHLKFEDITV